MKTKQHISLAITLAAILLLAAGCGNSKPGTTDNAAAPPKPQFTKESVIFSLSLISNINEGRFGTPAVLQQQAIAGVDSVLGNDSVQAMIGTWTPVWGPVTYTDDPTTNPDSCVSDNTMMLVKGNDPDHPSHTMYVLAIAGTIGASAFDWGEEDFVLDTMARWPSVNGQPFNVGYFLNPAIDDSAAVTNTAPYISLGMDSGLNVLFNKMQDASNRTLMQYLQTVVGADTSSFELAVAGHSLGGALSPCVALALQENLPTWKPKGSCTVTCYATAGQSPGNAQFANLFNTTMGQHFYGQYNQYDVVPHAFDSTGMSQMASLYYNINDSVYPALQEQCAISGLMGCVAGQLDSFNYTSLYTPAKSFDSYVSYNGDSIAAIYTAAINSYNNLTFLEKFTIAGFISNQGCNSSPDSIGPAYARTNCYLAMLLQQHFVAYINHYKIAPLYTIYQQQLSTQSSSSTQLQALLNEVLTDVPMLDNCLTQTQSQAMKKARAMRGKPQPKNKKS